MYKCRLCIDQFSPINKINCYRNTDKRQCLCPCLIESYRNAKKIWITSNCNFPTNDCFTHRSKVR